MRVRRVAAALAVAALCACPAVAGAHQTGDLGLPNTAVSGVSAFDVGFVNNVAGSTGGHVVVEGDRLYMGMYGVGMRIFNIEDPEKPVELGRWTPADSSIGPRAVADAPPDAAVFDGRHIAVLNGTNRTSRSLPEASSRTDNTYFLDTTDAANPELLWKFDGARDGESHNGDIVDERRLWLPSGGSTAVGNHGLRIYDLNPLLGAEPAAPAELFRGDPVALWAKSNYNPSSLPLDNPLRGGPAFTHTHDITVYPDFEVNGAKRDIALLAEGGAYANNDGNTGSLFVIDITNPRAPVVLQRWLHPTGKDAQGNPHHPIRYFHEAQFLDGDLRTVLVTDEDLHNGCTAGGVTALRLSEDLTTAEELSEWFIADGPAAVEPFGPICSVHVFSTHGNLAFFGSYNAGLQVVDYSDPKNPQYAGHNTQLGADSWGAQYFEDGLVFVGDFGARGLDVFRYNGRQPDLVPEAPTMADHRKLPSTLSAVVHNEGGVRSPSVALKFEDGAQLIGTATVPSLAAGEEATVSLPWDTKKLRGQRTVTVTVDVDDRIDESLEDNNSASSTFAFRNGPPGS